MTRVCDPVTSHLPLPTHAVVRITVKLTGDRYRLSDNGGAFDVWSGSGRQAADAEAMRRMSHYCELGHAVLPWSVPR